MAVQIQIRHDFSSNWSTANPTLAVGEMGVALDLSKFKVGDGVNAWNALPYVAASNNINVSAGTTSNNLSALTFSNSNGVSFGLNGSVITASAAAGANLNISAGTLSSTVSALTFSNGSGVSFGFDGSNITATVATNYQPQGAYLTTAALSQDSSKYAGTNGAITGGSLTLNTSGLSINLPAYLTTAMASNRGSDFVQANATFHGTNASGTIASDGISVSVAPQSAAQVKFSAGTLSALRSDITFADQPGASFGLDSAGNVTLSAFIGVEVSAGGSTLSGTRFDFYDANGVSWAMNPIASAISASVRTDYQSSGPYLTTAALSQDSSKYAGTSTGMTGGSVTLNTSGIAINLPAYLTTAAQSGQTSNFAGTNTSLQTTSGTDLKVTLNTTGLTVAYPAWITTYANDLTSGRAGVNTSVATTAGTDLTLGVNTSGVTIGYPKWITTYVNDLTSQRAGTNTSVQTTSGTDLSCALNTSGLTIAYPKWITTYVNDLTSQRAGTNTSVQTTSGTDLSCDLNTSGLTIAYPAWITTYVNDLTSQRAGTNTSVATTSGTDLSCALNTSGLTIAYPKWLTTADLSQNSSNYAGVNGAITGGSITVNTSGVSVNLPVIRTLSYFENMPILLNTNTMTVVSNTSHLEPFTLNNYFSFSYLKFLVTPTANSTTWGTTANTAFSCSLFSTIYAIVYSQNVGASSLSLVYVTHSSATMNQQYSFSAGNTGSQYTISQNISYPVTGSSSNLSTNFALSNSSIQFSTGSLSDFLGLRWLDVPFQVSLSPGNYWLGFGISSTSSTQGLSNFTLGNISMSNVVVTQLNANFRIMGIASTANSLWPQVGMGSFTTNAAGITSSIGLQSITSSVSNVKMFWQGIRQA